MLAADAGDTSEGRTAATNATVRTVFIVGPDKKIKLMLSYPMSTAATSMRFCACLTHAADREAQGRDTG